MLNAMFDLGLKFLNPLRIELNFCQILNDAFKQAKNFIYSNFVFVPF